MENGAFAPDGIISVQEGGGLIQEGADNIDLNTETIDGKDILWHTLSFRLVDRDDHPLFL
jgi:hypothetical protein